jgi:hypothetical protein
MTQDIKTPRLSDDQIGRIWFEAKVPGLVESEARRLIRMAEAALAQQEAPKGGGNLPPPLQAEPVQEPVARWKIDDLMRDAGWQNSAIRQADLGKVEKVVRAIEAALKGKNA